jgi:hypothetical protein
MERADPSSNRHLFSFLQPRPRHTHLNPRNNQIMRFLAHGYVVAAREMCLPFLDNRLQASELMRRLTHEIERLCRFQYGHGSSDQRAHT